jgi:hypothetical protein
LVHFIITTHIDQDNFLFGNDHFPGYLLGIFALKRTNGIEEISRYSDFNRLILGNENRLPNLTNSMGCASNVACQSERFEYINTVLPLPFQK